MAAAAIAPTPGLGKLASLWLETADRPTRRRLQRNRRLQVVVLGGGITGLTAALLFAREGRTVALLEARRIGAGATGHTTAKLSSLHGLTYARLVERHGDELARRYGEANEAGIARIAGLVEELGIDCELRRKPNFTYAESAGDARQVRAEAEAAARLGLPAEYVEEVDLPFPVAGAVRFDNQAEFHPVKYLTGLVRALEAAGGEIFEGTMAVSVSEGSPCRVETEQGRTVRADHVIVATHIPFLDRGLFFARTHPERSYVVAGRVDGDAPEGMYLSTEKPAHSIRAHRLEDGRRFLLVGGESHKTGQADAAERFARLGDYAHRRLGLQALEYHWATQDNMPLDGVPYVGKLHPLARELYVATGYRKWGLAMGVAAAELLVDLVDRRANPFGELFDPGRMRLRASLPTLARENANVGLHFFSDRLLRRGSAGDLARGQGNVVGAGLKQRAVYRGTDGRTHSLSARCTHLGCIVAWNSAERTWDCACHGSRFAATGEVIQGPAVRPLPHDA
jgi:glycine/D-amino acid oxidase-like deaminating enzyme/nitrite reductase/ring-hydroxylating ferredoxin subunit